ncbi:hypothetical protein CYMTET_18753 [Cymbomonas tetramitiformis]|uniref:Uncharacterized protein n=1 Tax=Cymbomonas tetramitiformis TaxID=36881 RepID=A0AAE0G7D8_9CHLO|nr:hypothetical protein CYMTET_18753 [Cymbomonas tetramitiformis]
MSHEHVDIESSYGGVHLCKQEEETGVVSSTNELWIERLLGDSKGVVPDPVDGKAIDICIGNAYLTKEKVDGMAVSYEGIRFLADLLKEVAMERKGGGSCHDSRSSGATDDSSEVCHFLDTGHYVIRNCVQTSALADDEGGCLHQELIRCIRSHLADPADDATPPHASMDVLRFSRMRKGDEDFTSRIYTRAKTRISFNVALTKCVADAFEYGTVEAYYLMFLRNFTTESAPDNVTVCRLAMVTAHPTVEDLVMSSRGAYVCNEADKHTLLMPTSRLETKVILHRPPGMNAPLYATYLWPGTKAVRCREE